MNKSNDRFKGLKCPFRSRKMDFKGLNSISRIPEMDFKGLNSISRFQEQHFKPLKRFLSEITKNNSTAGGYCSHIAGSSP